METVIGQSVPLKRGAEDSGQYFRYMSDFIGLKPEDAEVIRQTKPLIEKHLTEIVSKFYTHLLRYPPTRQWFLAEDGSIDQSYLELRMRHLTNFWLRTADALFDDDYARYVDYVGRAIHASIEYARQVFTDDSQGKQLRAGKQGDDGCKKRETGNDIQNKAFNIQGEFSWPILFQRRSASMLLLSVWRKIADAPDKTSS